MPDKSQKLAISVLEDAKKRGDLDPSIINSLEKLIGAEKRPKIKKTLKTPEVTKTTEGSERAEEEKPRELTPVQQVELLSALEARFAGKPEHYKRHEGIDFTEVKKALEANPTLMYSLYQMERTGGAPDIIEIAEDAFIFGDCSRESPNRRKINFDQAASMAKKFGVDMMSEDVYRAMQKSGNFDLDTRSWLATSADIRKAGVAMDGYREYGAVSVYKHFAKNKSPLRGWRGILRVPKA